jgi:DNA-binding transcriptional MocR family regulator
MGKSETFQDLSLMARREGQELGPWLYAELRAAILDGRLKPGSRMPSTRSLSKQYSLARGTAAGRLSGSKRLASARDSHRRVDAINRVL